MNLKAFAVAAAAVAVPLAGCGSTGRKADDLVWCAGPGEKVTAQFKREYPDLHIPRAACDAVNR